MSTHIVLIRGINVGTGKRVVMAELRKALTDRGFDDVRTVLNSGNAVLVSDEPADAVAQAVSDVLTEELGVDAEVIVRSPDQVAAAMAADPLADVATDGSRHFVGFLATVPAAAKVKAVTELRDDGATAPDIARLIDDHLYLWCPNGISKSTFTRLNWDRALGTPVTVRNVNTVNRLITLAG
jgi:uncharacterized protein (DUF1697 family)